MKELIITRHAKSCWENPSLTDRERPLKKRGYKDAKLIAQWIQKHHPNVDCLISSPAKRAVDIAKIILHQIEISVSLLSLDERLYTFSASPQEVLKIVHDIDNQHNKAMIFGHNPTFTEFVNALTEINLYNLPTSGTVIVCFDIDHWGDAKVSNASLVEYISPKMLKTPPQKES